MDKLLISKRFLHMFCTPLITWKLFTKKAVFYTCFSNLSPQSVSKRMQITFISRRFWPVFYKHLPKWKLLTKTPFLARFLDAFTYVKIVHENVVFSMFFSSNLVSTKCFKTHAKCIHFKTVFACVLHAFQKLKIAHKNAVFSTFFGRIYIC